MSPPEAKHRTAHRIIRLVIASPVKGMVTIGVAPLDPGGWLIACRCGDIRFVADSSAELNVAFEAIRETLDTGHSASVSFMAGA